MAGRTGDLLRAVLAVGRIQPDPVRRPEHRGPATGCLTPGGGAGVATATVTEHPVDPRHVVGGAPAGERRGGLAGTARGCAREVGRYRRLTHRRTASRRSSAGCGGASPLRDRPDGARGPGAVAPPPSG